MSTPCVTCLGEPDCKPKSGLFPCLGCKRRYCLPHAALHRQELSNELDVVIGERNELQSLFELRSGLPDVSGEMKTIEQWVKSTIEQVYQKADQARHHLLSLATDSAIVIKDQYEKFSGKLDIIRQNENFFEKDIAKLKEECTQLKARLDHLDINVHVTNLFANVAEPIAIKMTHEPEAEKVCPSVSCIENLLLDQKPFEQITVPYANGPVLFGDQMALLKNPSSEYTLVHLQQHTLRSTSWHSEIVDILCWSSTRQVFVGKCMSNSTSIILLSPGNNTSQNLGKVTEVSISHIACSDDQLMVLCGDQNRNTNIEEFFLSRKQSIISSVYSDRSISDR